MFSLILFVSCTMLSPAPASASSTVNIPNRFSSPGNMVGENRGGARPVGARLGAPKPVVATPGLPRPALARPGGLGVPRPGVTSPTGAHQAGAIRSEAVRPGPVRLTVPSPIGPRTAGPGPAIIKQGGVQPNEPRLEGSRLGIRPVGQITSAAVRPGVARPTPTQGISKPNSTNQAPRKPVGTTQGISKPLETPHGGAFPISQGLSRPLERPQGGAFPISQGLSRPLEASQRGAFPISQGLSRPLEASQGGAFPISQELSRPVETPKGGAFPISQGLSRPIEIPKGGAFPISQGLSRPIETPKGGAFPISQGLSRPLEASQGGAFPISQGLSRPIETSKGGAFPISQGLSRPIETSKGGAFPISQGLSRPIETTKGGAFPISQGLSRPVEASQGGAFPISQGLSRPIEKPKGGAFPISQGLSRPLETAQVGAFPISQGLSRPLETPQGGAFPISQGLSRPLEAPQGVAFPISQGISKPSETPKGVAFPISQGISKPIRVAHEAVNSTTQGSTAQISAPKGPVKAVEVAQKASKTFGKTQGPEKQESTTEGEVKLEGAIQEAKSVKIIQEAKPGEKIQGPEKVGQAAKEENVPEFNEENAKKEEDKPAAARTGLAKIGLSKFEAARQEATRLVVAKFGGNKGGSPKSGAIKKGDIVVADKPVETKSEGGKQEATQSETTQHCVDGTASNKPDKTNFSKSLTDQEEPKPSGSKTDGEVNPSVTKQGEVPSSGSQAGFRVTTKRIISRVAAIVSQVRMTTSPPSLENNPISQFFEIGKQSGTAGPGLVWAVYDALRKIDGKECSVFVFDKRIADRLFKPKRRETLIMRIRYCVDQLERMRHPRMLQIIHALEEGSNTLAFASESVLASLHNILTFYELSPLLPSGQAPILPEPMSLGPQTDSGSPSPTSPPPQPPPFAKEYFFIDIELRYGLLQIIEALHYMHYTVRQIHRNVCPQVIIVTKRGTWKLFGLEFVENLVTSDPTETLLVPPWSIKVAKICQPNLDFMAPEVQTNGHCNILSDMFSLGLVICAVFNGGKTLLQANNNPMLYLKQIECLHKQVKRVVPLLPAGLQEAVQRLLSLDPHPRPTTQLLPLIKYFKCQSEAAIQALQFLDVITMKDAHSKSNFYRAALLDALPYIPKKLRWQHVWPTLQFEVRTAEVLGAVFIPILWLSNEANRDEFCQFVLPTLNYIRKNLINNPKSAQAIVSILENMHNIIKKCEPKEVHEDILPILFISLDNNTNQVQTGVLIALQSVHEHLTDKQLHNLVLGKVKILLEKNQSDVKIISLVLGFFEKVLTRLERIHILEQVIPTLLAMRLTDPDIINRVVKLYKSMLAEQKFGLTTDVMAERMIPALAPQTINTSLSADQFANLMDILYDMLENIDKDQRLRLKKQGAILASPERHRGSRHQILNDNVPAPPFNIPNLRVEQRKTSSAEDMARKNSVSGPSGVGGSIGAFKSKFSLGTGIGQWFFGSSNSANNDNNFLRVGNAFPNRRLSDNTLMTPKIRIAPSCSSSPGGTPGGTSGLPTRRHSSIGPQERRGSAVNLSPPTGYQRGRGGSGSSLSVPSTSHCVVNDERPARKRPVAQPNIGGSMPNTSSSVPFLLTSSMQSIRSRRPSTVLGGSQGSGILQQLSSGMHQLFSGRT